MIYATLGASGLVVALNTCVLLVAIVGYMAILRLLLDFQSLRANTVRKWTWLVVWAYAMWLLIAGTLWYGLGYIGPRILTDGSWGDMPAYGWALIVAGVLAAITSLGFWVKRAMKDDPKALVSRVPRTLPLHPDLRQPKDGMPGLSDLIAKLPGNRVFDVQIVEEQVRLPRLPEEWEGLSILHISDLHLGYTPNRPFFEKVMEYAAEMRPDIIALTGDIIHKSARVRWIPNVLGRLKAPLGKYYLLGDNDFTSNNEDEIRDVMEMIGWVDIGQRFIVAPIRGKNLLIMGTQRPWSAKHTQAPMGTTVQFSIGLSHYPHHLDWASNRQFDLLLTGHSTGGVLNLPWPGLVGSSAKTPGLHYKAPTLMNVSHGLGRVLSSTFLHQPGMTRLVLHGPNPADKPTAPLAFDAPPREGDAKADPSELQRILKDQEDQFKNKRGGRELHKREELSFNDDEE